MVTLESVVFMSQAMAEIVTPTPGAALISITDSGRPIATLRPGWSAIHRASFDDIDAITFPDGDYRGLRAISERQAGSMARFVVAIAATSQTLVVHCKYGVSRSAGVAKAVAQEYGLPFPADYKEANESVCQAIAAALLEARRLRA